MKRMFLFLLLISSTYPILAAPRFAGSSKSNGDSLRDGRHDFDFNLGVWRTQIKQLRHPLTGSNDWTEMNGTVTVRKIWEGRAQLEEIEADGAGGHFEGLTLFLYNPGSHQWSMSFASSGNGGLDQPGIGEFSNGRGEFIQQDTYQGRSILVRFIWSEITPDAHHVEQSFSADGGKTWEPNFVANLTRKASPAVAVSTSLKTPPGNTGNDAQHAFDFDLGVWKTHSSRLNNPLTGAKTWTELDGTTTVKEVWDGRANIAELVSDGAGTHLELISLRLYNPQNHEWTLHFATSKTGVLSVPMTGSFKDGHGEFIDQEPYNGQTILVKFTITSVSPDIARSEQAFSADGGKTWETNWITTYTRIQN